ncbi:hypothetical protein H2200_009037 [Cladophialophora chaetospira]|uniref:Uncharacterized protein n=1 Tax=Cladophialophora chaetospira TaxID=386627 RepID=A0AA38X3K7_9EURO|nr:hypothetical protein H2200_009037 [Cladophialophora chaetospira]
MQWSMLAVAVVRLAHVAALPCAEAVRTEELHNANHIFNAIHSSMRQWGSSFYHNGMSLFPAVVPAGTQLYHGTGFQVPVRGLEWLAFEPDHSLNFARRCKLSGLDFADSEQEDKASSIHTAHQPLIINPILNSEQHISRPKPPECVPGWLHTYRTKEATPLLYIDGMSAGKCNKGTLDSQDVLLLNASSESKGKFWEKERADRLCKLAAERWKGKIKGFIRMEAGFEIIMCSFSESLEFVHAVRAGPFSPAPDPEDKGFERMIWEWVKFVSARYDGIGGGRVKVDYDNLITAYAQELDLFEAGDDLPRLENVSAASLDVVRNEIDSMIESWDPMKMLNEHLIEWQSVADMVVERYGNLLKYLVSGALTTTDDLLGVLELTLRVFIDSDARDTAAEVNRCMTQFDPPDGGKGSIASRSIWDVTRRICDTLFHIFDVNMPLSESLQNLWTLIHYLDWSIWKKCPECPYDEVCFIPMWPFGAPGDRDNPQCRNATDMSRRWGYWGRPGAVGTEDG